MPLFPFNQEEHPPDVVSALGVLFEPVVVSASGLGVLRAGPLRSFLFCINVPKNGIEILDNYHVLLIAPRTIEARYSLGSLRGIRKLSLE